MAKKRMFAQGVASSDEFLDLSHSAQALYMQLNLSADDEGFIGDWKKIMRGANCSMDDVNELINQRFVLQIDNILVVKHWLIHNNIRKERIIETSYLEQRSKIRVKRNKAYTDNLMHEELLDQYTGIFDDVEEHISFIRAMESVAIGEDFKRTFINTHRLVNQNCRESDKKIFAELFSTHIENYEGE